MIVFVAHAPDAQLGIHSSFASIRYRAAIPVDALKKSGEAADLIPLDRALKPGGLPPGATVVLAQPKESVVQDDALRTALEAALPRWRAAGHRLLLDICDLKIGPAYRAFAAARYDAAFAARGEAYYRALAAQADRIVVPSAALIEPLRAGGITAPVDVIEDVVEVPRGTVRFAPGSPLKLLWFGFFGAHAAAMHRFLAEDAPNLARERPLALMLLCEKLRPDLEEKLRAMALPAQLHVVPWSLNAVEMALPACDAVVLPFDLGSDLSVAKSSNRALQALYAGRAVFAHPVPSYRPLGDFIALGTNLPALIRAGLADPAAVAARTAAGQAHVAEHFSPEAIARAWAAAAKRGSDPAIR